MKRLTLTLTLLATPAFAQTAQPSQQAQLFAVQHQLAVQMQDDQAAIAQMYDLNTKLTDAQAQIKVLQAQLAAKDKKK